MSEVHGGATRRTVIAGAGAAGAAALLAGCSSGGAGTTAAAGGGDVLAKTTEVPVGGGTIVGRVVITQPTAGEFKGFSGVCTHQGCAMVEINAEKGFIQCGCHDSRFKVSDGSVVNGPATQPLQPLEIKVNGEQITLVGAPPPPDR